MHFPLCQTSDHQWTQTEYRGHDLFYNRRLNYGTEKLSVIALCSTERFVAVQVYQHDICGNDFLFFLQEALKQVPISSRITVLADNATWHTSQAVLQSKVSKALEFNAKGLFQANMIENAFSFIRAEFRKRRDVEGLEAEARLLLGIFFDERNQRRFQGIARNHLRSLISLLEYHHSALYSKQLRTTRSSKHKL